MNVSLPDDESCRRTEGGNNDYSTRHRGPTVTVLIAGTDVAGGDLDSVVATLAADHEVSRAETLDAVREALPDCSAVVVGSLPSTPASAVRETVRSGVYCPPTTPVIRLAPPAETGDAPATGATPGVEDYDGVVPADSPESVLEVLEAIERADSYRDAVEDLYEACRANASGDDVDEAAIAAALERADRAYADLPDVAGWSPYERVFVDVDRADLEEATEVPPGEETDPERNDG